MALTEEWATMPNELVNNLVLSMERLRKECVTIRGDHILTENHDVPAFRLCHA